MKDYYERRAREYDATSYEALGPAARGELQGLVATLAALPPGRVLDVACGTGWLTAHLRGTVVALDQSPTMLELAAARLPHATLVRADVPPLPFGDGAFDRVFTSSFLSHLETAALRRALVAEALRVAPELVVVEEAWRPGLPEEGWEERPLRDGTTWRVFKRYFTAQGLAAELAGEALLSTERFIVVRALRT